MKGYLLFTHPAPSLNPAPETPFILGRRGCEDTLTLRSDDTPHLLDDGLMDLASPSSDNLERDLNTRFGFD